MKYREYHDKVRICEVDVFDVEAYNADYVLFVCIDNINFDNILDLSCDYGICNIEIGITEDIFFERVYDILCKIVAEGHKNIGIYCNITICHSLNITMDNLCRAAWKCAIFNMESIEWINLIDYEGLYDAVAPSFEIGSKYSYRFSAKQDDGMATILDNAGVTDDDFKINGMVIYNNGEDAIIRVDRMNGELDCYVIGYDKVHSYYPDFKDDKREIFQAYLCVKIKSNEPLYTELPEDENKVDDVVINLSQESYDKVEDWLNKEDSSTLEYGINRTKHWFDSKDCAIMTAWRNGLTREEKNRRNRELQSELLRLGYGVVKVEGRYKEKGYDLCKENSFLIVNHTQESNSFFDRIFQLSEKYEQDCFLYCNNTVKIAILVGTNNEFGYNKRVPVGEFHINNVNSPSYTKVGSSSFCFLESKNQEK